MRSFLIRNIFFITPIVILFLISAFILNGKCDNFYLRFTSSKQRSLIIGTSRAAQGLVPDVMNETFSKNGFEFGLYNFSFTNNSSPFGPIYYNAIKQKLDTSSKNNLFIVTVCPWSISSDAKDPNDTKKFGEVIGPLTGTHYYSMYPNWEYIFRRINLSVFKHAFTSIYGSPNTNLHKDGWLEINVDFNDSIANNRTRIRMEEYRNKAAPKFHFSKIRFQYFIKTIETLKMYGKVFVVRLPVCNEMKDIENNLIPHFNSMVDSLTNRLAVKYINYNDSLSNYHFIDGNHLYKKSSKEISINLSTYLINELRKK